MLFAGAILVDGLALIVDDLLVARPARPDPARPAGRAGRDRRAGRSGRDASPASGRSRRPVRDRRVRTATATCDWTSLVRYAADRRIQAAMEEGGDPHADEPACWRSGRRCWCSSAPARAAGSSSSTIGGRDRRSTGRQRRPASVAPSVAPSEAPRPPIRIGSDNFYESKLVAEIYAQVLENAGYKVERKFGLGSRQERIPTMDAGQVDLVPEYVGSGLGFYDKTKITGDGAGQRHGPPGRPRRPRATSPSSASPPARTPTRSSSARTPPTA